MTDQSMVGKVGSDGSAVTDQSMVGKVGSVVRDIRGGKLPGEIRLIVAGEAELFLAYSEVPLDAGVRVRVVRSRGSRQLDVAPWP